MMALIFSETMFLDILSQYPVAHHLLSNVTDGPFHMQDYLKSLNFKKWFKV
jgi:hypothetical protein